MKNFVASFAGALFAIISAIMDVALCYKLYEAQSWFWFVAAFLFNLAIAAAFLEQKKE